MSNEISNGSTIESEHVKAAQELLDAVHKYWKWRQSNGLHGAVCWIRDTSGRLLVFTRGEYASVIERLVEKQSGIRWEMESEDEKCPECGYPSDGGVCEGCDAYREHTSVY